MADESDGSANWGQDCGPDTTPNDRPALMGFPELASEPGASSGVMAATIIVVAALAAVSEIVLPLTFAVVLAVVFQPAVGILVHHRFKPSVGTGFTTYT